MNRRRGDHLDELEDADAINPRVGEIQVSAASFYYALLKNGYSEEATEFAEWFLDTFDLDLES